MSIHSIKQYYSEVEKIKHFGGSKKETAIRNPFYLLLNEYAKQKGLMLIAEISIKGAKGKTVTPDGTLKDSLRQDWGYWESKDEADIIDDEIEKKFSKGYPKDNILFEDSHTAVLIQKGNEVMRVDMRSADDLDLIIREFIGYERPEVANFHKAIELFKQDIPKVTDTIKRIILEAEKENKNFKNAESKYWQLCKESINPEISLEDIREMMIQHILTEDIFNTIFDETQFHRENNIARELEQVILTFFTGNVRRSALGEVQHYYQAINAAAAQIADHHEKQKFLKVIYEVFYKGYNPKAADRLGVVYTPNEIVKFMIESTDYLLYHHFGKGLEDKGVEILDPATGTGTFICDIIDYIPKDKLPFKYEHEIHANEIAILPYYIANLNIEYTYKQKTGDYKEFENLCFVDTLDNVLAHIGKDKGKQTNLFALTLENLERIKKQNSKKISVIIGNPPYNANQMNENDNNKNRSYFLTEKDTARKRLYSQETAKKGIGVDDRIKETFIKNSTAQKTKVYDMYSRFYRWSMDRIGDDGVICFISNNSYINAKTFDGFRKCIHEEFQYAYIIDLGGNIRELSGKDGIYLNENHTIFGQAAAVGISIMWLVRDKEVKKDKCIIKYIHPTDIRATRDEKLSFLQSNSFKNISFENVIPDKNNNWINLSNDNDWEELINLEKLFRLSCNSIKTNRDEWVYDFDIRNLKDKSKYLIDIYSKQLKSHKYEDSDLDYSIKWSSGLKEKLKGNSKISFSNELIITSNFRPFIKKSFYCDKKLNDRLTENHIQIWGNDLNESNLIININDGRSNKDFHLLSTSKITDYHFTGDTILVSLYCYDKSGNCLDNITFWGLNQFQEHYKDEKITKEDIFNYVYAVLHNPVYRKKYELNLKRDFPRVPFYDDFHKWASWGKSLMDLHINYESVKPFDLGVIIDSNVEKPKAKLKSDRENGIIVIDEATTITGIPPEAWQYKLGNRSALDWILDQYKEKKPNDPTIREKFNTYRFSDYKDQVIDLLKKVCKVSVETVKIVNEMA